MPESIARPRRLAYRASPRAHARPELRAAVTLLAALLVGCGSAASSPTGGSGGASSGGGGPGTGGGGGAAPALQAEAIAVGAAHTCALLSDATVACWGDGSLGQLGDGQSGDHHSATPAVVPGLSGATAVRAAGNTTCAVIAGGAVTCWGDGAYGQLGNGKTGDGYFSASPVPVSGITGAVDVATSGTNACAVLDAAEGGAGWCWGLNAQQEWLGFTSPDCGPYVVTMNGQQMLVNRPCEPAPRQVPGVAKATSISDGGEHVCAILEDGTVRCWGADDFGQLGDGVFGQDAHTPVPTPVAGLKGTVARVALGASHTCALVAPAHEILCWGDNSYGQLGISDMGLESYKTTPTQVTGVPAALDLDAAVKTTCAVASNGTVACWGDVSKVSANPPSPDSPKPVPIQGVGAAVGVRTGGGHACALRMDQSVVCWGRNDLGQVGNGIVGPSDFSMAEVQAPAPGGG